MAGETHHPRGRQAERKAFYGKTQAEVRRSLTAALKSRDDGLTLPSEALTVASHLNAWLVYKVGQLRPETLRRYTDYVTKWIIPEIGRKRLAHLSVDDIHNMHKALTKRGLSATSRQHTHGVLRNALQDGLRWGRVSRNVASLVPAPRRSTGEQRFLGPEDAKSLLEAARGFDLEALFIVALTAGLREGELQGLKWGDIDFTRRRVRVVRTLTAIKDGAPVFGEPKTLKSRRTVWLSATAVEALERHRTDQDAQRRLAGDAWVDYNLVFSNPLGLPLWRSQIRRRFKELLVKAGLPDIRFHDLRHTAATLLLSQNVPIKVASEALGHSDIQTTLRIYAHCIDGAQAQAADAMDALFHG